MSFLPDPSCSFDTFVVGPENRMAAAAARRAAESPGTSYNPLFLYGAAGVGKSHLLKAVGDLALSVRPDLPVVFRTAGGMVDDLSTAVAEGAVAAWRDEFLDAGVVLLDDVQGLGGRGRTQEELLSLWDDLLRNGAQVVLAADRSPVEIAELNEELRARLTGGLTVDVGIPEAATRRAIAERWARAAHLSLAPDVLDALAALPFDGVESLHRAVERVGEEGRNRGSALSAAEAGALLAPAAAVQDEFSAFLFDIASTVEELVEAAPWRRVLAEAILRWEGEGIRTRRLEEALEADSAPDVAALTDTFAADVARLRQVEAEIGALDADAARSPLLRDPDRLREVEALLKKVTEAAARAATAAAAPEKPPVPTVDRWFLNGEKMAWSWIALDDRLMEELG